MAERADQGRDLLLAGRFRIVEKLTFSRKWIGIDISTGQKVTYCWSIKQRVIVQLLTNFESLEFSSLKATNALSLSV